MVFISLGLRALTNVEALNMVESVGNIVRHRKAAVVYKRDSTYVIRWVPVVSGESIAHSYQAWLASLAVKRGLPVCEYCEKFEFVKHADTRIFGSKPWEQDLAKHAEEVEEARREIKRKGSKEKLKEIDTVEFMHTFERTIIENCVVEDVGGFLYAGELPVKRTSRFASSYMMPALDAIERAVIESQFQVRHAPTASQKWEQAQMPYNVEVGSAIYALSFYIDLASIGYTSAVRRERLSLEERRRRVELAIDALALMLDTRIFGARQSRFSPVIEYEVVLASLSDPISFNVSPPTSGLGFIGDTAERARAFKEATKSEVWLYAHTRDDNLAKILEGASIKVYQTLLEMFDEIKKTAVSRLG